MKFIFDLDGTLTSLEVLPTISQNFDCQNEIGDLTAKTLAGNVPFIESFIRKVNILGDYSVDKINAIVASIPIYSLLLDFIQAHKEDCVVVTGNLSCWCKGIFNRIGCECYGSEAKVEEDRVVKIEKILRKEVIIDQFKAEGEEVVYIGDGNNDLEAMRHADISIASGLTHYPSMSLLSICDYAVFDEGALFRQLNQLAGNYDSEKSVVICCAGIGSRLGLGLTKALVQINDNSLISTQLKLLKDVKDLRVVIGFQAQEIIEEVSKYRNDVIYCYNHRYFETKTGASYYLGARHANNETIVWDGDLLVHPDDVKLILNTQGEFVGYGDITSDDAICVSTDENGRAVSFSRKRGDYEWTGPACIHRDHMKYCSEHVYNMLEPICPMKGIKVRAYDIDTYNDYVRVSEIAKGWEL